MLLESTKIWKIQTKELFMKPVFYSRIRNTKTKKEKAKKKYTNLFQNAHKG